MRNRTRISSLDAFGLRDQRNRIYPALEASDGSTLSLDFTAMSSLDSRFTFTRSSTATFINSSGLVQFANANLMTYSTPRSAGSAWGVVGTVTWGSATITDPVGNSSAQEVTFGTAGSAIFNTTGATVTNGITHTFSVWMRAATGTTNVRIGDANVGAVSTVSLTTTWQRFSCQYVSSGTNDGGAIYSQTGTPSATFYVWGAQVQPGSVVGELLETTGTIRRDIPRFDYDPTTLAPRGLLIEGSATNLLCYSESFATSGGSTNWGYNSNTGAVVSTPNPEGGSTAFQFAETANSGPLQQSVTVTNAVHTFSAWFKGSTYSGTTTTQVQFGLFVAAFVAGAATKISGPGSVSVAANIVTLSGLSTSEWTRVQFTTTSALSAGAVAILIYPNSTSLQTNASFYIWGAQLETGSGASSYIPTGSSTVQRAVDQMTMANISALSFNQAGGTVFMQIEGNPKDVNTFPYFAAFEQSPSGRGWTFLRLNNSTTAGLRMLGTAFNGAGSAIISSTVHTRPSGKFKFATTLEPSVCRMTYVIAGGSALVDTVAAGTLATIGSLKFNNTSDTGASEFGSVWISQFKYWPSVLPNATLQSLTQ